MKEKLIIIIGSIVIIAALGGGLYYFLRDDSTPSSNSDLSSNLFSVSSPSQETSTPTSLEELPDVVAKVNGQNVPKSALEKAEQQIIAGQQVDVTTLSDDVRRQLRIQALDAAISNELVRQATLAANIMVADEEIDAEIAKVKGNFDDEAAFQAALTQQGMTDSDFRSAVSSDIAAQKYLESTLNLSTVDIAEEELQSLYKQESDAASTTQPLPPLEEIHDDFKAFFVNRKQLQIVQEHLKALGTDAEIEVLI